MKANGLPHTSPGQPHQGHHDLRRTARTLRRHLQPLHRRGHYVLAYGYGYERLNLGNGYTITKHYLKCNMGWNGVGPRWYNLEETFYAADCRLWNGPNAP